MRHEIGLKNRFIAVLFHDMKLIAVIQRYICTDIYVFQKIGTQKLLSYTSFNQTLMNVY